MTAYRRLPGTRRGFIRRASAWVGEDHILLVEGSRTSEKYRRVYLRDVQALTVERRNQFIFEPAWLWLLVAMALAGTFSPRAWRETQWIVAAVLLLAIPLYLVVAGMFYSCRLFIATAVGNVKVGSVFRTWQARRFHEAVTPLVLAAQAVTK